MNIINESGQKFDVKIPKAFERTQEKYDKIKIDLNMRLSVIIPRIRERDHRKKEKALKNMPKSRSGKYYSKGIATLRQVGGKKRDADAVGKITPRERASLYGVHRKYFD